MKRMQALAVALTLAIGSPAVMADTIEIFGDGAVGNFTGTLDYSGSQLSVTLNNTSPAANGGYITGFLFNINGDATATLNPNPTGSFQYVTNENGMPFGTYQFGASLNGNWQGPGAPQAGIGVGESKTFIFDVTGPDAGSLSVLDFFTKGGTLPGPQGESDVVFAVRFTGFEDGDSDKVSGEIVPMPAAVWPGLALLGGLLLRRRRM